MGEILSMSIEEFNYWIAYFENKYEAEKKELEKARNKSKLRHGRR